MSLRGLMDAGRTAWEAAHPGEPVTEAVMLEVLAEARAKLGATASSGSARTEWAG